MKAKTFLVLFALSTSAIGCGNKDNAKQNDVSTTQPQQEEKVQREVKPKDKLEENGQYLSIKGNDIWCVYNSTSSANFGTSSWLSEDEIKAFIADREIQNSKSLSFHYMELSLPPFAAVVNGKLSYNEDIPHTFVEASKYQSILEEKAKKEQAEKERLAKIEEEKAKREQSERERQALREAEEDYRHDAKNFTDYLNSITIGSTMKDFNQAIYMLSDSGNEFKILYNRHGDKALKLKEKLITKQKQVFPIIRRRYVNYFREAFRAMGRGDIKFVQSGTTLNLLSDEFYEQSVWDAIYESMGIDMSNYRFKKLILKSSNGRILKQYSFNSKNDDDL